MIEIVLTPGNARRIISYSRRQSIEYVPQTHAKSTNHIFSHILYLERGLTDIVLYDAALGLGLNGSYAPQMVS